MGIHDPFHLISTLHGRYVGEYQIHLQMETLSHQTCDHVIESLRHKYPAEGYVLQGLAAIAERCRGQPSYNPNPAP
jgi:hypothetical protein